MLFIPSWKKTAKPSLAGFIAWLETKDPKATYRFMNSDGDCPVDQYYASCGIPVGTAIPSPRDEWHELNFIASYHRTFGKLLEHAKEFS